MMHQENVFGVIPEPQQYPLPPDQPRPMIAGPSYMAVATPFTENGPFHMATEPQYMSAGPSTLSAAPPFTDVGPVIIMYILYARAVQTAPFFGDFQQNFRLRAN